MIRWAHFFFVDTDNLGDEIQTIAAKQFLPRLDYRIDRDAISDFVSPNGERVALVSNGWFSHRPEKFIAAQDIIPLFVSVHFSEGRGSHTRPGPTAAEMLSQPEFISYLKRWEPIGARDIATHIKLQESGIESYFSGCLTLTLERTEDARDDYVLCVDIPESAVSKIRRQTSRPVLSASPLGFKSVKPEQRFEQSDRLLKLYQRAHCVITSRLHCALPCLAFDVPVFVIESASDSYRFSGLRNFYRHATLKEFLAGDIEFDIDNPENNASEFRPYRANLVSKLKSFCENPVAYADNPRQISLSEWAGTSRALSLEYKNLSARYDRLVEQTSQRSVTNFVRQRKFLRGSP